MTDHAEPRDAEATVMDALAVFVTAYTRDFGAAAAEQGLTMAQAKGLALLGEPVPMRSLADRLSCDASNITGLVDRLEGRRLVQRSPDEHDRRVKNVVSTPDGAAAVRRVRAGMRTTASAVSALDEDERRTLDALLRKLNAAMDEDG